MKNRLLKSKSHDRNMFELVGEMGKISTYATEKLKMVFYLGDQCERRGKIVQYFRGLPDNPGELAKTIIALY